MIALAEPCTVCGAAIGAPCTVTMRHGNEAAECCAPHESRGKPVEYRRWTLHGCGEAPSLQGFFGSLRQATEAWEGEGKPGERPAATEVRLRGASADSLRTVLLR